jgi:anti-sigma factor RsiW
MTPQWTPRTPVASNHLTEDQFGELLSQPKGVRTSETTLAEAHLSICEQCADELATLRESVSFFRQASSAYADNELRKLPPLHLPVRPAHVLTLQPTYWAVAAAIVLAAFLPIQTVRQHPLQPGPAATAAVADRPVQSEDEALLEGIDTEISASVPSPMQALVDPTGGASGDIASSVSTSTQRKD